MLLRFIVISLFIGFYGVSAQEFINVGGGNAMGTSGSSFYSIGIPFHVPSLSQSGSVSPGVQGIPTSVVLIAQSLTFPDLIDKTYGDSLINLGATSSSGLTVTYISSNPRVARIDGMKLVIVGAGTATITANQAGNNFFAAGKAIERKVTIKKALLSGEVDNKSKFFGDQNPDLTMMFTGFKFDETQSVIDILPTISTSAKINSEVGSYSITASGGFDDNYEILLKEGILKIDKSKLCLVAANKTKVFGENLPLLTFKYEGFKFNETENVLDVTPIITTSANKSSNVGTYSITISGGSDNNYDFKYVNGVLTVIPAPQTITFNQPGDVSQSAGAFSLTATSSSGLSVVFSTVNTDKISIAGSIVNIKSPGIVTVTASQSGNGNYLAAESASRTFCINPSKPTVTASGLGTELVKLSSSSSIGNQWYRNGQLLADQKSSTLELTESGVYGLRVTIDGCAEELSDDFILVVTDLKEDPVRTGIMVYPNPTKGEVIIKLSSVLKNQTSEIKVLDGLGRVIHVEMMQGNAGMINIDVYPPGAYFLKIKTDNYTSIFRIFKQ